MRRTVTRIGVGAAGGAAMGPLSEAGQERRSERLREPALVQFTINTNATKATSGLSRLCRYRSLTVAAQQIHAHSER